MSARYTQSKQETAKHLAILKNELKRPENKLCADCKRNDPRWASTNLGCFMCIRCSGIHRGMGVHITRIKSVDLDTWTPEQIANVQRWGNKRANLYWEAHLKQGHVPPDHKMESFIRSKYELKRWAMQGPLPDPETLDGGDEEASAPAPAASSAPAPTRKSAPTTSLDLLSAPPSSSRPSSSLSSSSSSRAPPPAPVPPKPAQASLFDLDFGSPAPAVPAVSPGIGGGAPNLASPASPTVQAHNPPAPVPPKRDAKADILSLFAATPAPPRQPVQQQQQQLGHGQQASVSGVTGGLAGLSFGGSGGDAWGAPVQAQQPQQGGGFGGFESFQSAGQSSSTDPWASSTSTSASAAPPASSSVWGAPASAQPAQQPSKPDPFADFGAFTSSSSSATSGGGATDIWGSSSNSKPSGGAGGAGGGFSDIWA
ncbi:hypothetical protein JCM8547_005971 [Rhodosporidiobolus lusitaniae]